jgi:hypothetical protein
MIDIPFGYCKCGCGQKTNICLHPKKNKIVGKGEPYHYIHGHNRRNPGKVPYYSYPTNYVGDRHGSNSSGHIRTHITIAEKVLGKKLPPKAVVHHVDSDITNNANSNLVICENNKYHLLIHRRTRAYYGCGNASWRKCWLCQQWDDPNNLYISPYGQAQHRDCKREYDKRKNDNKIILWDSMEVK